MVSKPIFAEFIGPIMPPAIRPPTNI